MINVRKKENTRTLWQFFWGIIKPYKGWYLLMFQAPVVTALYVFANNYSLKLLVDAFSMDSKSGTAHLICPIVLFIAAQISLDIG